MRTPNGPLFKRHEILLILALMTGFVVFAILRVAY
jgi:hypothetical protein